MKKAKFSTSLCPRLNWFLPGTTSVVGTNENLFNISEKQDKGEQIMTENVFSVLWVYVCILSAWMFYNICPLFDPLEGQTYTLVSTSDLCKKYKMRRNRRVIALHYWKTCSDTHIHTYIGGMGIITEQRMSDWIWLSKNIRPAPVLTSPQLRWSQAQLHLALRTLDLPLHLNFRDRQPTCCNMNLDLFNTSIKFNAFLNSVNMMPTDDGPAGESISQLV